MDISTLVFSLKYGDIRGLSAPKKTLPPFLWPSGGKFGHQNRQTLACSESQKHNLRNSSHRSSKDAETKKLFFIILTKPFNLW
jgi:hypothetical protein